MLPVYHSIYHRPEVVQPAGDGTSSAFLIPIDLNNLPSDDLSTLYRGLLRAFYEARERFDRDLHGALVALSKAHYQSGDPFVAQTALREWLK